MGWKWKSSGGTATKGRAKTNGRNQLRLSRRELKETPLSDVTGKAGCCRRSNDRVLLPRPAKATRSAGKDACTGASRLRLPGRISQQHEHRAQIHDPVAL